MTDRPNILLICCDQLRYDSLGFSGANAVCGKVSTPNLDRLAAEGLWFDNAYTALPTCCPARQSMLAGKRAESFGALWNFDITSKVASLTPDHPTWTASMKKSGYRMAYVGKWHVSPTFTPLDFGYDSYYDDGSYSEWRNENFPGLQPKADWFGAVDPIDLENSHTHVLAKEAIGYIREYAEGSEPWHVRLDFSEPHLPCCPCKEFAALYDPDKMKPWPSFDDTFEGKPYIQKQNIYTWGNEEKTWDDWKHYASRYFAVISQTDDAVGRVLRALEETGQADNTIVIFTADHGDMAGSHRMMDKHYVLYDDTVHIPLIIRAPGTIPGRIRGFVNNCLDMAPTMTDLCGGEPIETDGYSLLPQIENAGETGLRDHAMTTLNGQQFGLYTQRMLRTEKWKYIWNLTDVDELYDMENDPWEMKNLAREPEMTALLAELRKKLYGLLEKEDPDLVKTDWLKRQLLDNHKL